MSLVITRHIAATENEDDDRSILDIGPDISVRVVASRHGVGQVKLLIDAPDDVRIVRREIAARGREPTIRR